MSDFYADSRYYIDFSKIVVLEHVPLEGFESITIVLLGGHRYTFYEKHETEYKAFKALKAWHEEKIKP